MKDSSIKSPNPLKFRGGTHFGKRGSVRIKLSDKDLVLIAGIVVAAIIALTTIWLDASVPQIDSNEKAKTEIKIPSGSVLINKIGTKFIRKLAR